MTALELFANDEIQLVQVYYEPVDFYGEFSRCVVWHSSLFCL